MYLKQEQIRNLRKVAERLNALKDAKSDQNDSGATKCACFYIKPFHNSWDKETVDEVIKSVRLYIISWLIEPLESIIKQYDKEKEGGK